jgi:MFS family permease
VLFALASMVGLRMLGLFLVLPVFTLYGLRFTSSKFLVGFAFGAYALTMAILQIPLGRLSDRIGRRRVLVMGMTLFSVGSILCALPPLFPRSWQIWELIFGRLVQGGGAIISVAFATVADYIEPERRSTAMAVLGIPIGISFAVGIIVGPILAGWFGTASLFWLTGFLGLGTDFLLMSYLKDERPPREAPAPMAQVFSHPPLLAYAGGGFLINLFMTTFFFHFPLIVTGQHHLRLTQYYELLLPMMLISGVTMFGFSQGADKGWARPLASLAYLMFIPSFLLLFAPASLGQDPNRLFPVFLAGTLFYIGFTGLEPILPSLVSKTSLGASYGTSLGFYNTSQFLGSTVGGSLAGALANYPPERTMLTMVGAAAIGFLMMAATRPPVSQQAVAQHLSSSS